MASVERFLWLCVFSLHDEERLWRASFKDQQEVEDFFAHVSGLFPCLTVRDLKELKRGALFGPAYFHYRLSDYVQAEKVRKLHKIRLHTNPGQPAPLTRDLLSSFVFYLPVRRFCAQCLPAAPIVQEIAAAARSKRRNRELALLVPARG